jgi:hypothetical protein
MKKIAWQKCERRGASGTPTVKENVSMWDGPITPGLHVDARYSNLDVHLRIKEELAPNLYSATVMYFEPVLAPKPNDLFQDDKVEISREYICWHHKP